MMIGYSIKKRIISAAAAIAMCFAMAAPLSDRAVLVPDVTAEAVTYGSLTEAQYAQRVADLVNQQRAANGAGALILSDELCQAANFRAKELVQSFSHTRPNGTDPWTVLPNYGVSYTSVGENIAMGQRNADEVMNAWMNSDGHRKNILKTTYKYLGVGVYYSNGTYYWVQFFATGSGMTPADVNPKSQSGSDTPTATAISGCDFYLNAIEFAYTGSAITPELYIYDGDKRLVKDTDYTVSFANNINPGQATATVTGTGSYTGTVTFRFNITRSTKDISECTVNLSGTSFAYTGSAIKPGVTVKDGNKTLTANTDYTVSYSDNINAGTGRVTITGINDYTGSVQKTFTIAADTRTDISGCKMTIRSGSIFNYTGSQVKPTVVVKDGNTTLANGTDYTVTYSNNVNEGMATLTVTGKGNYKGSLSRRFAIKRNTVCKSGDLDRDGIINEWDIALLQQYVSEWNVVIDERAANVNGDSKIDEEDIARLQQYVSGWSVRLVLPS